MVTNTLNLQNISNNPLTYKIKTTAPKRYIVRPNIGLLQPGESVEIQVSITPSKDKPEDLKKRDKFLVQVIPLTIEQMSSVDPKEMWLKAREEDYLKYRLKSYFTKPTPPVSPHFSPLAPQFSPTIPHIQFSPTIPVVEIEPEEQREEDDIRQSIVTFADVVDSQNDQTVEELMSLRVEKQQLSVKYNRQSAELEELKSQISSLQAEKLAFDREKEAMLRQRKTNLVQESQRTSHLQLSRENRPIENESILTKKWVQLLIVAFLFFYLGRIL
eukprot:TRINITY_DN13844_c0_g1_i1.p1 TRINITY_DN13844_c0_g1~~TRINITY_DN13844_c0_g1_i1.p1  ORF type:complete len:272 (-),score=67.53 TRINITY_DN13844_c0_g1_i1:11-826(-)